MTCRNIPSAPILNLQLLRALAAIAVVVFHSAAIAKHYGHDILIAGRFQNWGASGVDVFFVISGFVMVLVQGRTHRSPPAFLWNRVARIVPLYWALTVTLIALAMVLPKAFNGSMPPFNEVLISLARSMSFTSIYFDDKPVLYLGWTLEYEMLFYIVFAGGIAVGRLGRGSTATVLCVGALVAVGAIGPLALEFLFGIGLAHLYLAGRIPQAPWLALLLILGAVVSIVVASATAEAKHWLRVAVWGIPALALVISALMLPQIKKGIWTFLGDASYAIYLIQVFSIPFAYKLMHFFGLTGFGNWALSGAILVSVAAGVMVHILVERPLTRLVAQITPWGRLRTA